MISAAGSAISKLRTHVFLLSEEPIKFRINQIAPNGTLQTSTIRSVYITGKYLTSHTMTIAFSKIQKKTSIPKKKKLSQRLLRISLNQNNPKLYAMAQHINSDMINTNRTSVIRLSSPRQCLYS